MHANAATDLYLQRSPVNPEHAYDEMIAMSWKHENVYIGTDAHSPKYWPPSFVHYIRSFGQDKVVFGTDFPVLDFERTLAEIDAHGFPPDVMRKLLRDNVARIYGLAL